MEQQSGMPEAAKPRWGVSTIVKVLLSGCLFMALLLAGGAYFTFQYFVSTVRDTNVFIEDLQTGAIRQVTTLGGCSRSSLSPDGKTVVFQRVEDGKSHLMTHSLQTGASSVLLDDGSFNHSPVWGGQGKRIYYLARENGQSHLWRRDLDGGGAVQMTDGAVDGSRIQMAPDGAHLLLSSNGELFLVPTAGGPPVKVTPADNFLQEVSCFAWSPTSQEFAYVSFLSLVVAKADGTVVSSINLAGLNNFSEMVFDPTDPDTIVLKAREADSLTLSSNLYRISRRAGTWQPWKTGRGLLEMSHDISRDGTEMVYTK